MQVITYPGSNPDDRPMGPAPLSPAVFKGTMLFVSGQVGIDPRTGSVVGPDIRTQARQVLLNIRALVEAAGMSMADVVKVGIFLTDPADFAAMNEVYAAVFAPPFPARAAVGVRLNDPALLVEMDAVAIR